MKFFDGDITKSGEKLVAHGCNAQGKMGSGVALAIATKWPKAKEKYLEFIRSYQRSDQNLLGTYSWIKVDDVTTVFNIITQENYGKDGAKYARYWAIYEGFNDITQYWGQQHVSAKIAALAANKAVLDLPFVIAIPKIGCSLGGLDWEFVELILQELEEKYSNYELEFHVYNV